MKGHQGHIGADALLPAATGAQYEATLNPGSLMAVRARAEDTEPILRLDVVDGQLVAEYDPANLDTAALRLVDELVQMWRMYVDAGRGITVDVFRAAFTEAADPAAGVPTITVDRAAELVAALMWPRRPRPGDRVEDGGQMGTLVRCGTCGGSGLLHRPDELPDTAEPLDPEAAGRPAPAGGVDRG